MKRRIMVNDLPMNEMMSKEDLRRVNGGAGIRKPVDKSSPILYKLGGAPDSTNHYKFFDVFTVEDVK